MNLPDGYWIDEMVQIGELTRDNSADFTFVNEYRADKLDLYLIKQNRRNESLSGVSFKLWKAEGSPGEDEEWESIEKSEIGTYTTDADGKVMIPGLDSGIYYLQETETIAGYMLWEKPLRIEIDRTKDGKNVTITTENKTITVPADEEDVTEKPGNENDIVDTSQIPRGDVVKKLTIVQYEDNRDTAELTVINEMAYELPNSGGMGIFPCILSGVVMMMAACGLYFRKRREDGI